MRSDDDRVQGSEKGDFILIEQGVFAIKTETQITPADDRQHQRQLVQNLPRLEYFIVINIGLILALHERKRDYRGHTIFSH
ncbi:hypothetical protein D3C73_1181210 [compost metagenome]